MAVSFVLNKSSYSTEETAAININRFDQNIFDQSVDLVLSVISSYQSANSTSNLINMAKTRSFTDTLLDNLNEKF